LFVSPYITKAITSRRKKIGEIRDTHGEKRNAQSVLAVKPEEKRTLEGPRRRFCKKKWSQRKRMGGLGRDSCGSEQDKEHSKEPNAFHKLGEVLKYQKTF
jgi:hypothetical protein